MSDTPVTGTLVTAAELTGFVPGWADATSALQALLVQGVEDAVKRHCHRDFASTVYTNEEITIKAEIERDGYRILKRDRFRVKHYPITVWTSLEKVTDRDAATGKPSATETIARDSYWVDMTTGEVHLLEPDDWELGESFPDGVARLLAAYTAGEIPAAVKLAVLMAVARIYQQQKMNRFGQTEVSFENTTVSYPDFALSEQEKGLLAPHRRLILV